MKAEFQTENSFFYEWIITMLYTFKIKKINIEGKNLLVCHTVDSPCELQ